MSQTHKTRQCVDHNPSADTHLAQRGAEKIMRFGSASFRGGNPSVCPLLSFFCVDAWQLIGLRFMMGLALGGLLPSVQSVIRRNVPDRNAGSVLGYLVSSQFADQVVGPMVGGFIGGHFGMKAVFLTTAAVLAFGAACARAMTPDTLSRRPDGQ